MANLKTVLACVAVFLWNFNAIGAATTTQIPDYGEQSTYVKHSWFVGGLLPENPENERASILCKREHGTLMTNQTQGPFFLDGYVRVDVQFQKKTESVSTELREVLRKLEEIQSSLKTREAESPKATKNEDHLLGSGNVNQPKPGDLPWTDCWDVMKSGHNVSGVYKINPLSHDEDAFTVYCNMDTHGGGWTVFQQRHNGLINFYQNWRTYKAGFGKLDGEFWLGLEHMYQLTNSKHYELLIELKDWANETAFAKYDRFVLGSETEKYPILLLGTYSGTAGDALTLHAGQNFSTWDMENGAGTCASHYTGAWWFKACFDSHLNGLYLVGPVSDYPLDAPGLDWGHWRPRKYSMRETRMSIRPRF